MPQYKGKKVNGCTGVPEILTDETVDQLCYEHDLAYQEDNHVEKKIEADAKLILKTFLYGLLCLVKGIWFIILSLLMIIILSSIGWFFWFKR